MNAFNKLFEDLKNKDYFVNLLNFIEQEYKDNICYPTQENIFKAFEMNDISSLKVVIIGQDPYHEENQANGLAFSITKGNPLPPSLKNIYKEIDLEYNSNTLKDGELNYLKDQGVLLLNKYLTVREHQPLSHKNKYYDLFFIDVIKYIEDLNQSIVYLLWGRESQKIEKYITNKQHIMIKTTHPSPLGANKGGWFNSICFRLTNQYLNQNGLKEIEWIKKR